MKRPPELPHIGGVDVTVKDAWHIGTAVDGYELSAQGITVTMLEEYLFHILWRLGSEVRTARRSPDTAAFRLTSNPLEQL